MKIKATLDRLQIALLRSILKGWDDETIEFIVKAVDAYEPHKKEISRLFELAELRGKQCATLLEAAQKALTVLLDPDGPVTTDYDMDAIKHLEKAIAQAEARP